MWVRNEGTRLRRNLATSRANTRARRPQLFGRMKLHYLVVLLAACASNDTSSASSNLTGNATYRDATTDHTEIDVHAELDATTENCSTYCAASARADAEASCGTSAEAQAAAQCQTTCTQSGHRIAADLTIGAGALEMIDADSLRAAAFGDLHGDLTFDHVMQ
jgi:hypothetical protein